MATLLQKRAKEIMNLRQCTSMKQAMLKAGYALSCANKPGQKLVDSKGFQQLEKAEKASRSLDIAPADVRTIIHIALAQFQEDVEAGRLDDKTKLMLVKVCGDLAKSNPEMFDESAGKSREDQLDEALRLLREKKQEEQ